MVRQQKVDLTMFIWNFSGMRFGAEIVAMTRQKATMGEDRVQKSKNQKSKIKYQKSKIKCRRNP